MKLTDIPKRYRSCDFCQHFKHTIRPNGRRENGWLAYQSTFYCLAYKISFWDKGAYNFKREREGVDFSLDQEAKHATAYSVRRVPGFCHNLTLFDDIAQKVQAGIAKYGKEQYFNYLDIVAKEDIMSITKDELKHVVSCWDISGGNPELSKRDVLRIVSDIKEMRDTIDQHTAKMVVAVLSQVITNRLVRSGMEREAAKTTAQKLVRLRLVEIVDILPDESLTDHLHDLCHEN